VGFVGEVSVELVMYIFGVVKGEFKVLIFEWFFMSNLIGLMVRI
jgi:hypothetical protein